MKNNNDGSDENKVDEACWKGYHKEGNKKMFGRIYPNCVKNENASHLETEQTCPNCNGQMFDESMMNEKKDACYYKVKSRYKVWPSAYASGALVKCRNAGASNWGNKSESNELGESLHDWFTKEKWVRMDTKGNIKGPCAKEPGEGKPKCLPQAKAHSLGKEGRASAARRKRREDPNPNRHGHAINVATEASSPAQQAAIAISKKEHSPVKKLLEQKFKDNLKEINIRNSDGNLEHVNKVPIRMADGKIKLMDPGKSGSSGGGR